MLHDEFARPFPSAAHVFHDLRGGIAGPARWRHVENVAAKYFRRRPAVQGCRLVIPVEDPSADIGCDDCLMSLVSRTSGFYDSFVLV